MTGPDARAGCTPATIEVLALAALCGGEVDLAALHHVVAGLVDLDADVLGAVAEATTAGVLAAVPGTPARFAFTDAATAAALVDELPLDRRADLHARLGDALERTGAPPDVVAAHLFAALPLVPSARAVAVGRRAAAAATRRQDHDGAVRFHEQALAALAFDVTAAPEARAEMLVDLGRARMAAGDLAAAHRTLVEAVAAAELLPTDRGAPLAFAAAMAYARWPTVPRRDTADAELRALLEAALAVVGPTRPAERATVLARLAQSHRWSHDQERGHRLLAEADALAGAAGDPMAEASVLLARRLLSTAPEAHPERATATAGLLARLDGTDHPDLPLALFLLFADQLEAGELTAAATTVARQVDQAEQRGEPGAWWYATRNRASLALLSGHLDDAEVAAAEARRHGEQAQHPRAELSHEIQLLHIRLARGDLEASLPFWRGAATSSPWHLATHAWLEALVGSPEVARSEADELLAHDLDRLPSSGSWLPTVTTLADAVVALGRTGPAAELRAVLAPHAARTVVVFNGVVCTGRVDLVLGRLAALAGDWGGAEAHLREATTAHDARGAVLLAATARAEWAAALWARGADGDADRAAQLAAHAAVALRSRGAARLEAAVPVAPAPGEADAADLGVLAALSPRELEVLDQLALGRTNKEIAAVLHVSAATVQRHTINLYRKLQVSGRSEAAALAARHRPPTP